ncbi:MAG: hypothetical protein ACLSUW_00030 [Akkermansia sp.]
MGLPPAGHGPRLKRRLERPDDVCGLRDWRLDFPPQSGKSGVRVREWQRAVSPGASRKKRKALQIFFYLCVDAPDGITILEENLFLYVFPIDEQVRIIFPFRGSLSLDSFPAEAAAAAVTGKAFLPAPCWTWSASLSTEDGLGPWNIIVKLTGNGSDLPQVSINAASSNESAPMNIASVVPQDGIIRYSEGNFTITSGQWTAPGPIVVTNRDKAFIDANISFNSSNERESCGGTFTGSITYQVPVQNDEGGFEAQDWTATEGTVSYTVS